MRTTLTLDPDVAALLERLREERETTHKALVNEALRLGLAHLQAPPDSRGRHVTRPRSLGGCRLRSVDDVADALALAEGERFR